MRFLIFAPQTRQCMLISRLMSHRSQDVTQLATTIWYPKEPFIIMVVSIGWMNQNLCQREFSCGNHHFHLHPFKTSQLLFAKSGNQVHSEKPDTRHLRLREACLPHERLFQGETDGSSFPNGGLRVTHSAAAFTTWDRASPPFVTSVLVKKKP